MGRYRTKPWDSPEMNGYPSYCVWDKEREEIADENGLLLVFSSVTGEIACKKANEMTKKLNEASASAEEMKKCEDEIPSCRIKLDVIGCAEKKGVKCPIIDYTEED